LANESVDVIVIVHVLEFVDRPKMLLREAYQALAPGGQIIIISINPFSLWGLVRGVRHCWTSWRIKHWLSDLRLRMVMSDAFCFRPPMRNIHWWRKLLWLEAFGSFCFPAFGGLYILAA